MIDRFWFNSFYAPRCQHDDRYIDGRSQIKVHTDERTQVHIYKHGDISMAVR